METHGQRPFSGAHARAIKPDVGSWSNARPGGSPIRRRLPGAPIFLETACLGAKCSAKEYKRVRRRGAWCFASPETGSWWSPGAVRTGADPNKSPGVSLPRPATRTGPTGRVQSVQRDDPGADWTAGLGLEALELPSGRRVPPPPHDWRATRPVISAGTPQYGHLVGTVVQSQLTATAAKR